MLSSQPQTGLGALRATAVAWFFIGTIGQWIFAGYILGFFGPRLLAGTYSALNDKTHITGYVTGDWLGNSHLLAHVLLAATLSLAGALQLVPALRKSRPNFHRWNGRLFMLTAVIATLSGFYLTWVRGSRLDLLSALGTTLNGLLILVFVVRAWRSAVARDLVQHRKDALRAYLLVNGVWFLRIMMIPTMMTLASLGLADRFGEAAFQALSFLSYVLPLALLELYFHAERSHHARTRWLVAGVLGLSVLIAASGIVGATVFMWLPRM
jgi:hypothetical protein